MQRQQTPLFFSLYLPPNEFAIAGYLPIFTGADEVGALLVAYNDRPLGGRASTPRVPAYFSCFVRITRRS